MSYRRETAEMVMQGQGKDLEGVPGTSQKKGLMEDTDSIKLDGKGFPHPVKIFKMSKHFYIPYQDETEIYMKKSTTPQQPDG